MIQEPSEDILDVFRILGIASEEERQQIRRLGEIERFEKSQDEDDYTQSKTCNNTLGEERDAKLEPTS